MTGLCGREQARGTLRLSAKWGDQGACVSGFTVFPVTGGAVPVVATRGGKSASSSPSPRRAPGMGLFWQRRPGVSAAAGQAPGSNQRPSSQLADGCRCSVC